MRTALCGCISIGALFAAGAFGSACPTASLAVYDAAGFSCTVNDELADNFTFSVVSHSAGYTPLTASQITVTPSFTATSYQFFFSSTGFSLTSGQSVEYEINFTWDPVVVGSEDDMVSNTPVFPGFASVTTNLCAGSLFGGACPPPTNTLFVFNNGNSSIPKADTSFVPVTIVDTQSFLTLDATMGGSSEISGFSNSVFTPEPSAFGLMTAGFFIAWIGRLARRRKPVL